MLCLLLFVWPGEAHAQDQQQPAMQVVERPYWKHRVDLFYRLPDPLGEIVFLGDSITDGNEWREMIGLSCVTNRGISGDTAWGIRARIQEVVTGQPSKIFIMVGTNDLAHGQTVGEVHDKISEIVRVIQQQTPAAEVYLQNVLPVADRDDRNRHNERILALNQCLADLAEDRDITWVDVASVMRDADGQLQTSLSDDGLHPNGKGYYLWYSVIRKHLNRCVG